MFDGDESKQICKVGGPFVLIICCPLLGWTTYYVFKKSYRRREVVTMKDVIQIGLVNLFGIFIGPVSIYKGYEEKFRK